MIKKTMMAAAQVLGATSASAEPQAEVVHWWTSGGEAKLVQVLMDEFASRGAHGQICQWPVAAAMPQ